MNFNELRKINVNDHIEKKGKLSYLSWAWAVDTLLQNDPTATWEYGEPKTFGKSLMVFCKVTAFNKSMTAQLPVLDYYNKAVENPDAMQVNTAMQRCLAKAIALHGIGLYIYAGEDIPQDEKEEKAEQVKKPEAVTPTAGASNYLTQEELVNIDYLAGRIAELVEDGKVDDALKEASSVEDMAKVTLWSRLDSKTRSTLKKEAA